MIRDFSDISESQLREFWNFCIGERLGYGVSRETYIFRLNPKYVVKHEYATDDRFQNVVEHKVWETIKDGPYAKFFAPCEWISASGNFLLQRRVYPLEPGTLKVPNVIPDLKQAHFGMMDGRVVCCDYGTLDIRALDRYFSQKVRLVKVFT